MDPQINPTPQLIELFEKIRKYFQDFHPETRTLAINYHKNTATIGLFVKIEPGYRKNHNKIKIPMYGGLTISKMRDMLFHDIGGLWKQGNGFWYLDAKGLPPSDGYFIELEGELDEKNVKDLVRIQPAINRDSDEKSDKFWLDASIKNPALLSDLWKDLQIDNVDVGISVDFNKMFRMNVPEVIRDREEALKNYLQASTHSSLDRNMIYKTLQEYRRQMRIAPFDFSGFVKLIEDLLARKTLLDYLYVDKSYEIGKIDYPKKDDIIPRDVLVQTLTTLTLRNPQSQGTLTFKRQEYLDRLEKEFKKFMEKQ